MLYPIFCVLQGDSDVIGPIKLDENETVGELREQIKNRSQTYLKDIDTFKLKLYRINVNSSDQNEQAKLLLQQAEDLSGLQPLDPMCKLSTVWEGNFPGGYAIHIMAQPSELTSCRHICPRMP
jgi:hypothetical protein